MEPLKTRIGGKNGMVSLSRVSELYNGYSLGFWSVNTKTNEFSYYGKSANRTELYTLRGRFFLTEDKKWVAKLNEVSRMVLSNFFGKPQYDKIHETMHIDEVIKILGTPAGVFFAGEVNLGYPNGRRANCPFVGNAKEFEKDCPWFFAEGCLQRAWISNDIAIWITFDVNWKVCKKTFSKVWCPNEEDYPEGTRFERLETKKNRNKAKN